MTLAGSNVPGAAARLLSRFIAQLLRRPTRKPSDLVVTGSLEVGANPDEAVLTELRAHGADLTKPTHILFYIYAPTESGARAIADRGVDATLRAEVRPSGSGDGTWLCLLQGTFVPTLAALREYRRRFESLAASETGEYDGWEAAVTK